jgi:hypothetical protein
MRFGTFTLSSILIVVSTVPSVASTRTRRSVTPSRPVSSRTTSKHAAKPKIQSQRTIDDDRATQIQAALIKAGYLTGEPSGHWDAQSSAAMQKLQAENGWQTKLVPDSRALIKLGLGPGTAALAKPPDSFPSQPSALSVAPSATGGGVSGQQ